MRVFLLRSFMCLALTGVVACGSRTTAVADEPPKKAAFAPEPLLEEPKLEAYFSVASPACQINETVSIVGTATVRNVVVSAEPSSIEGIEARFAKTSAGLGLSVSKVPTLGESMAELTPDKGALVVGGNGVSVMVPSRESPQQAGARWAASRSPEVTALFNELGPRLHLSRVVLGRSVDGYESLEINGHPEGDAMPLVAKWASEKSLPPGAVKNSWLRRESGPSPSIMVMMDGDLTISITREGGPPSSHACLSSEPSPSGFAIAPSSSASASENEDRLLREMMGDDPHR